jgi:hypothetical protein
LAFFFTATIRQYSELLVAFKSRTFSLERIPRQTDYERQFQKFLAYSFSQLYVQHGKLHCAKKIVFVFLRNAQLGKSCKELLGSRRAIPKLDAAYE